MNRIFTVFMMSFLVCQWVSGQLIIDFEGFDIGIDSAIVNSGSEGHFDVNGALLPNFYDSEFNYFTDWVISSEIDTLTAGVGNSTSAYAGGGYESNTYAVASAFFPVQIKLDENIQGSTVLGLYVTNNTYAALSMRDGDAFAKSFGGETGDDPDYLKLSIKKWFEGELSSDSVEFYLADYRFEDNNQDYIVKEWSPVNLEPLGPVDSLQFQLFSSDVGAFGINTPTFFCVDDIEIRISSSVFELGENNIDLKITPNPATDFIEVESSSAMYSIFSANGTLIRKSTSDSGRIYIGNLKSGVYYLGTNEGEVGRFIKF